jgi:hypothetical protein
MNTPSAMTASAWVYHNTFGGGTYSRDVIIDNNWGGSNTSFRIIVNATGNVLYETYNGSTVKSVTSVGALSADRWNYVTVTYDKNAGSGNQKIYINGKQDSNTNTQTGDLAGNAQLFYIGGRGSNNDNIDGFMDDVKIYNYARSAEQILVDYNAGAAAHLGAGTDPNEGDPPVGYWKLDENTDATAYDRSGNGNNGTITGASWAAGKYASGLNFDGNGDYVDCGNSTILDFSNAITLEAWVKFSSYNWYNIVFKFMTGSASGVSYGFRTTTTSILFDTNISGTRRNIAASSGSYPAGEWYHLVGTYNGTNLSFYINGKLVSSPSYPGTLDSAAGEKFFIGQGGGYGNFVGLVDDVRVYNYARTPAQISYDYNKGKPVAHYRFDEGYGSIAHSEYSQADSGDAPVGWWRMDNDWTDSSGNGNNGTAYDNATFSSSAKIGPYCGTFDGTGDYVEAPNVTPFQFINEDFTIEFWTLLTDNTIEQCLIDTESSGWNGWAIRYDIAATNPNGFSFGGAGTDRAIIDTDPSLNVWHHVAITYSETNAQLKGYLDGALDKTISENLNLTAGASVFTLGSQGGASSRNFKGRLDDVRIYNYARTAEQVHNDYKTTHSTLAGNTKFVDGKIGKALNFDGSGDYVIIPGSDVFNLQDVTISCWTYSANYDASMFMFEKTTNGGVNTQYSLFFDSGGSNSRIYFRTKGLSSEDLIVTDHVNGPVNNQWNYMAATYNSATGTKKIYCNGKEIASVSGITGAIVSNSTGTSWIGTYGGGSGYPFNGKIDDMRIYNYARTAEQILQDYNAGAVGRFGAQTVGVADPWGGALPLAHWKMDENTGVLAQDASGNGYNGVLVGDAAWTQGKNGACLSFDGTGDDDYVDISSFPSSPADLPYTFTVWIKPVFQAGGNDECIVGKNRGASTGNSYGLGMKLWDSKLYGIAANNNSEWRTNLNYDISAYENQWTHVAFSISGLSGTQTGKLYVNGILVNTYTGTAGYYYAYPFYIGNGKSTVAEGEFKGLIDDVKLYNYVRTPAQIAWDYNRGSQWVIGEWMRPRAVQRTDRLFMMIQAMVIMALEMTERTIQG